MSNFTLIICLIFIITTAINSIYMAIKRHKSLNTSLFPERHGDKICQSLLTTQILFIFIYGAILVSIDPTPLHYYGLKNNQYFSLSFMIGAISYFPMLWISTGLFKLTARNQKEYIELCYLALRSIWPRNKSLLWKLKTSLCINPFTEEFLFRGVLVYYLSSHLGWDFIFISIGLVACLLAHVYQGLKVLIFHAIFYFITIALLYSPLGLWGCFGFHFIGDLYPLFKFKEYYNNFFLMKKQKR